MAPDRLAVYTRVPPAGFDRPETRTKYFSERRKVTALAAMHPNMDVIFVDDASLHAYDLEASRFFAESGYPPINVHNLGWFAQMHERVRAGGYRVLLDGQSGNFSLGWRGMTLLHERVARGRWIGAMREILALRRVTGDRIQPIIRRHIAGRLEPALLRRIRRRWLGAPAGLEHNTFVAAEFSRRHGLVERIEAIGGWNERFARADPFDMRAYWLINGAEVSRAYSAHALARFGFEMRDPLADARLVEFCLNVPTRHYLRDGRPRALQRDTIADRVPREIAENHKLGEQTPEWFDRLSMRRAGIATDIERIAQSPLASHAIDIAGLRDAVKRWPIDAQAANALGPKFRYGVARAVQIGNFIRWFEGGNR